MHERKQDVLAAHTLAYEHFKTVFAQPCHGINSITALLAICPTQNALVICFIVYPSYDPSEIKLKGRLKQLIARLAS